MSEPLTISELLACVLGGDYLNYGSDAEVLADIARMLPDRDAKLIARAKREQMEADCAVRCFRCKRRDPVQRSTFEHADAVLYPYEHPYNGGYAIACPASDIRAAWAKKHQEEAK